MTATIRDVAQKANVGIATVSRVLNNNPAVNPDTRDRVLAVIRELDYTPNQAAQRLSLGKTKTISVILPYLAGQAIVERLRGIQKVMEVADYDLVLYTCGNTERRDHLFTTLPRKAATDGILIISMLPNEEQIERFIRSDIPAVLIDAEHPRITSFFVDNTLGGFIAANHLLELGHRRISFIGNPLTNVSRFSHTRKRYDGFRSALAEWEVTFQKSYHLQVEAEIEPARQAALGLLQSSDRPTAIFAANDTHALGVLKAAVDLGLSVPGDLSVIGFDDIPDADLMNLTTIHQPLYESGEEGINHLLREIRGKAERGTQTIQEVDLVLRGTTAPLNENES
ncbi:MAG: LacI family DNA-binding transcriptional regulator [Anaerolineales bacterium]|nr:LacI family DNA-binding transcriptional regulator [Anaerolineales bacterium]